MEMHGWGRDAWGLCSLRGISEHGVQDDGGRMGCQYGTQGQSECRGYVGMHQWQSRLGHVNMGGAADVWGQLVA